ncbi:redox-regulated ATPase YchF [bacterium]|nr:redox-regulated ATPase YchF [bacterium]
MPALGLFGAPGSGKSTVFAALTGQKLEPQYLGYEFKPRRAVLKVPDPRVEVLAEVFKPRSVVHATVELVDIPGFDPAGTERKLKIAVLGHYRRCDALALVVNLWHPPEAGRAALTVNTLLEELVLSDLVTAEKALPGLQKSASLKADEQSQANLQALLKVKEGLEGGAAVRRMELAGEERKFLRGYAFLSAKPVIAVFNVADDGYGKAGDEIAGLAGVEQLAKDEGMPALRFAAALEAALSEMPADEAREYMAEFGVEEPGIERLMRTAYAGMGLVTFFTYAGKEVRAWSLPRGSNAQQAAGVIHSDMAQGFIRAEAIGFDDFVQYRDMAAAKAAGKVRPEGKEYEVADGDILLVRFSG